MARYGIVCDVEKCDGCYSCFLSCKDEYVGNDHPPLSVSQGEKQSWIRLKEVEYGTGTKIKVDYIPIMCQHCDDPACMKAGPEGAVYKREDGVVIIDPLKAKGAKEIVGACPYNCVFWNEALQLPQKCTMCMHMIESGEKLPRCVECCPTGALVFGDLDDPESEISKLVAEKKTGWRNSIRSLLPNQLWIISACPSRLWQGMCTSKTQTSAPLMFPYS